MFPPSLKVITSRGDPPLAAVLLALKSKVGGFAGAEVGMWWKLMPAKLLKPFNGFPPSGMSISTEYGSLSLEVVFVQNAEPLGVTPKCPAKKDTEFVRLLGSGSVAAMRASSAPIACERGFETRSEKEGPVCAGLAVAVRSSSAKTLPARAFSFLLSFR